VKETGQVSVNSYGSSTLEKNMTTVEKNMTTAMKILVYVGMAFVLFIVLLTAVHTVGRYVFHMPIPGVVELSSYCLVVAVYLAVGYVMVTKGHVYIGLIVDRYSPRTQAIIDFITHFLCLVFVIIVSWQTIPEGIYVAKEGQSSTLLGIPNFPFYYLVSFGFALMGVAIILHMVNFILKAVRR